MSDPAPIGHNQPPEPTPFEQSRDEIEALFEEAKNWLDGAGVQTQADADAVSKLLDLLRTATKTADERRKAEAKPLDEAKAEIQARYNTLIGETKSVTGKAVLAMKACKDALAPFLARKEAEQRAEQDRLRREAEEAAKAAQEARQDALPDDLEARERAEMLADSARIAAEDAKRADKWKPHAKGGSRAVGLRTYYTAEVTDAPAFARHVWQHHRTELDAFMAGLAQRLVDHGQRSIPGVIVKEERRVA